MRVNDDLYILPIPLSIGGNVRMMNLSLIVNGDGTATLVDAGLPGQEAIIEEAMDEAGYCVGQISHIVLTHHDIDHVGALRAIADLTNAETICHTVEKPYIEGELPPTKMPSPERLAQMPEFAEMLRLKQPCPIQTTVEDGDVLPLAGGIRVVFTPGHTPGHISLYLERSKTLITGDALVSEDGVLQGPNVGATPDMVAAVESVKRLAKLDVETIVCYHGGVVGDRATEQLLGLLNS